ncbi:TPA: hypothetical protein ACKRQV_001260 [Pseudomonas aeruginosa]
MQLIASALFQDATRSNEFISVDLSVEIHEVPQDYIMAVGGM